MLPFQLLCVCCSDKDIWMTLFSVIKAQSVSHTHTQHELVLQARALGALLRLVFLELLLFLLLLAITWYCSIRIFHSRT